MLYYKIPVIDGRFDYPAGCVLCCAFPVDSYMYCKFERVTSVGSGWVEITESEFNVRCPEFPAESLPIPEVIAAAATLGDGPIRLIGPEYLTEGVNYFLPGQDLPADVEDGRIIYQVVG